MHVPAEPAPPAGVWSLPGAQVKHASESDAALHVAHVASQSVRQRSRYRHRYVTIAPAFTNIPGK